jgi:tetratricopeptide (TPR) repeat protein
MRAYLQTSRPTIDEDEPKRVADEARLLLDAPGGLGDPLRKRLADGMTAYARGDPRAQEIVAEGLEKFRNAPGAEELHWLAGLCARWDRRIPHFDAAIAQRPKYALALYGRAVASMGVSVASKALEDLEAAIRLWPAFADAYLLRGYLRGQLGERDAQAADFAMAERLDPGDLHVHLYRGIRLYDLGDFAGSVAEYTKILDRSPRAATVWSNRGNSKSRLDDLDGAIADHTESIRLVPHHNSYLNRATVHLRKRDRAAAMRDLDASLKLWPDYGDALYLRGVMLWEDGRHEEGYANVQRSVGRVVLYPDAAKVAEEMRRKLGK